MFDPAHRWHHTKPFWCKDCDQRFSAKGNLVGKKKNWDTRYRTAFSRIYSIERNASIYK
jgi:hypothetical protein